MTKDVDEKLHSDAPVVAIEAAGGCGKTTKAAKFAKEAADRLGSGKVLLLSHTHAACGEFQRKCYNHRNNVDVDTCDSFYLKVVGAYARALGLPTPVEDHLGRPDGGVAFSDLSVKAAELFRRAPTVTRFVAAQYPIIVLDEHQDASVHQHAAVDLLREIGGSQLRMFGDPMQAIHPASDESYVDWERLWAAADDRARLEEPHRWSEACELGEWIMACRAALKAGYPIPLQDRPRCVSVSSYTNLAGRHSFRDVKTASRLIHDFLNDASDSAAILAFIGDMTEALAKAGSWRAPLNEGAQLAEVDRLINAIETENSPAELANAFLDFLRKTGVGLTEQKCTGLRRRLGATINRKQLGKAQADWLSALDKIYASPDHRGVAAAMRVVKDAPPAGYNIRYPDHAWALSSFTRTDNPRAFLNVLGRIRRQRKWPPQMVSTIHKSKGLEFDHVLLCPVDIHQYPDNLFGARLLYVALSRAQKSIQIVHDRGTPTQHLKK